MRHLLACLPLAAALCGLPAGAQAPARVDRAGDAIVFEGRIDSRSVAVFLQLLQDPAVNRLVITSQGGIVGAALEMADAVHERHLDLEVPSACHSSCANYIFPAARRKLLAAPGAVAWHGNMAHLLYLQQAGQQHLSEAVMVEARKLAGRESDFFGRIGVDGFVCWFAKVPPFGVEDSFYLSVADMERFGIGGVTLRARAPASPDTPGMRLVAVDWTALEAARPRVP